MMGFQILYIYSRCAPAVRRVLVENMDNKEFAMDASPSSNPVMTTWRPKNSGGGAVEETKIFDTDVSVMSREAGFGRTSHTPRLA